MGATQLAVGWVNDWLDADRDRQAGRRDKPVAVGEVSRRTVGVSGLLAALAIPLLGLPFGPAADGVDLAWSGSSRCSTTGR